MTSSSTGTYSISIPPRARDENPFETQPISIAAVRAALDAQARQKVQEAGGSASAGLTAPPADGHGGPVVAERTLDPDASGSRPPPTPPPLPLKSTEGLSDGVPVEQRPIQDPFADWDGDDEVAPSPPPPETVPATEEPPVASSPVEGRKPPAAIPEKRGRSWLLPALVAVGAVAVAVVLVLVLRSPSKPSTEAAARPVPREVAPVQAVGPPLPPAEPPPPASAATEMAPASPESPAEGEARESVKEKRRAADERRSKERKGRAVRQERPLEAPAARRGPPSREQIVEAVRANWKAFESCATEATKRAQGPSLAGRSVNLRITVRPSGSVDYPTLDDAELTKTDLGACLKTAARLMVFPRFEGEPFHAEVPIQLGR